jgi:hypothetical protein
MKARVLLFLASFVLSLSVVEGAQRFQEARLNRDVLPDAIGQTAPLAPGEFGTRVHVLALHGDPEISDGLRNPERPHAKPAGTLRILGLAD